MTAVQERPADTLVVTPSAPEDTAAPLAQPTDMPPASSAPSLLAPVLTSLGILLLGFVLTVSVLGNLRHARDQQTAYAELRKTLAEATAPVGQTTFEGKLVPLGTPVALLTIPQIGLNEVVLEGTTSGVLRSGPGHRRDTPLPGQAGFSFILGRQAAYGAPFADIKNLRAGEEFTVTTGQGEARYRVLGPRRAGDPVPPPPPAGKGRLVLSTGNGPPYLPDGVLRVDADLVTDAQPSARRIITALALPASEGEMKGDATALVALLLWAQAFLLATAGVTWARVRWGRRQAWVVGVPLLAFLGVTLADELARLLPNLL